VAEQCVANTCIMASVITGQAESINAAHNKLRDHEGRLSAASMQTIHCLERLSRVETATDDNHRLLVSLEAQVDGLSGMVRQVVATSESTHVMLQKHINDNTLSIESVSRARILSDERTTSRLIKIGGVVTILAIALVTVISKSEGSWTGFLSLLR